MSLFRTCSLVVSLFVSFPLLSQHNEEEASPKTYILYVRPSSSFGQDLRTYWSKVKNSDLSQKAITDYPPHCTLTGFFDTKKSEDTLIEEMNIALKKQGKAARSIQIVGLRQNPTWDYIELNSPFLLKLTKTFVADLSLPTSIIKGIDQPYHITLSNHKYKKQSKKDRIMKLERQINLKAKASWSLFLYRQTSDGLEKVEEVSL